MVPSRARAAIVAAAMCGGSISKKARRDSRVSLRPNPSVPSATNVAGTHGATAWGTTFIQSEAATIGPPPGPQDPGPDRPPGPPAGVERVPAVDLDRLPAEEREGWRRVDLRRDPEPFGEQPLRLEDLEEDGPRSGQARHLRALP